MKGKDKIIEVDTQIKEKIGFASLVYDWLYTINKKEIIFLPNGWGVCQ